MKLEVFSDGSADCPLVRLSDFLPTEIRTLRAICRALCDGSLDDYTVDSISSVESIGGCRLTLKAGSRDQGLVLVSPPSSFEWTLSRGSWDNVDGLLEPFETVGVGGHQWLNRSGVASVLVSRDGSW